MADAVELLSAARTAASLDRLAAAGRLSDDQRRRLAADPATGQLGRLLRQVELAGRDPEAELERAVAERPLDGAESVAAVLHTRLSDRVGHLVPRGDTFADRLPATDDPTWRHYLSRVAELADQRARELGAEVAESQPQWARQGLGPLPAGPVERLAWEERAGRVAAYREMADHNDEAGALGPAPKAGRAEHHAAWHSAWRALGRPESGREEAEMSDGQLLVRVRAYKREEAWAPTYVADDLGGTSREAAKQRQEAILLAAAADRADKETELRTKATLAAALADLLDQRVRDVTEADAVRTRWYVHTAETRAAADRARAELADRGVDPEEPADAVPTGEWLAAHRQTEDPHQLITAETDFADGQQRRADAVRLVEPIPVDAAETAVPDVREVAASEPAPISRAEEGRGRVASADDTASAVARAQRALFELRARTEVERRQAKEAHVAQQGRDAHRQRTATDAVGRVDT